LNFLITILTLAVLLTLTGTSFADKDEKYTSNGIWIEPRVEDIPGLEMGPFVRLEDGAILTVDRANALISHDEGKTWDKHTILDDASKCTINAERALIRTRSGVIILAFMNVQEKANWNWDPEISDSRGAKLPTYVVRSLDGGKTWQEPKKLHDAWTGAIRDMIETKNGTIVFTSMMLLHDPGRHSVLTYASQDDGETWTRSNIIDLGGIGNHGGVTEATLVQLRDGRLWKLIRTNWKVFWQAFSDDDGISWRTIGPTTIDASCAPGMLTRLESGRLMLVWNRYFPEGKNEFPLTGGDNQWSEVPVSNHRLELSMKFSDDDGKNWTEPVVIAKVEEGWLAYPYVFESRPGEIWITTMQGGLRVKINECDFVSQ